MKSIAIYALGAVMPFVSVAQGGIDRKAVVDRNCPVIAQADTLGSLSVGNGRFAVTVDVTGLQSYPKEYANGVPVNAMSQWGWHSFPNTESLMPEESQKAYDLHGRESMYAIEHKSPGRGKQATEYFRANPHRLNLGTLGLKFTDSDGQEVALDDIADVNQRLDLWQGIIESSYTVDGVPVRVTTGVAPESDRLYCRIISPLLSKGQAQAILRFAYPTGKHSDDANDWNSPERHATAITRSGENSAQISRDLDDSHYTALIQWGEDASLTQTDAHTLTLKADTDTLTIALEYSPAAKDLQPFDYEQALKETADYWAAFWQGGGFVDFGACTDERAPELERRVILSQYLTQVNCGGDMPPQETGLTYNSWFGRPHLEMTWWHAVDFALWGHEQTLARIMDWYNDAAMPEARKLAQRQNFDGVRWQKMTDPEGGEAPSNTGSFLIWQQPHYIYFAEQLYLINPSDSVLDRYGEGVEQTARFMADYAAACEANGQIKLYGQTAMQESMTKDCTYNHPFEHAYWVYGLKTAQDWRERRGQERNPEWDRLIALFKPLRADADGKYNSGDPIMPLADADPAAPTEGFDPFATPDIQGRKQWTTEEYLLKSRSDHPAVLGACGLLPDMGLYEAQTMARTYDWIADTWEWQTTWGWDYGMTAMCAARLGMPEKALDALLCDKVKNTYLVNGHNYQEPNRLRIYLPGNGALLDAVAMMCAGWTGSTGENPGFPADGTWQVRWEGLRPMQ